MSSEAGSQLDKSGARRRYLDDIVEEVDGVIGGLQLSQPEREYLELRWRPRVLAAKDSVRSNKRSYYFWRLPAIVGAVVLPPLASPNVEAVWARWAAFGIALIIAVCTGIESLFRFGNRWRIYRQLMDALRTEIWAYRFRLEPAYEDGTTSFGTFVQRSEEILRRYSEEYITDVLVIGAPGRGESRDPRDAPRNEALPKT